MPSKLDRSRTSQQKNSDFRKLAAQSKYHDIFSHYAKVIFNTYEVGKSRFLDTLKASICFLQVQNGGLIKLAILYLLKKLIIALKLTKLKLEFSFWVGFDFVVDFLTGK